VLANGTPTGGLIMWGTGTAPSGWLLCTGTAVSRTTYAALFAVIGTTFGIGDGSTTFNLPNYTNRMPYGTTIGATGGSADAVVVSHTHTVTDPGHLHTYTFRSNQAVQSGSDTPCWVGTTTQNTSSATTGISIDTAGVSGTNANLPPYLGINFIIKT
jgi:microcystin-dependent protein